MKIKMIKITYPKTRMAALHLGAYIVQQIENCQRKRGNLMSSIEDAKKKIKRLELTLEELDKKINGINSMESNWQEQLKEIQTVHLLTESEILEEKSRLLRAKISSLQKLAGAEESGTYLV